MEKFIECFFNKQFQIKIFFWRIGSLFIILFCLYRTGDERIQKTSDLKLLQPVKEIKKQEGEKAELTSIVKGCLINSISPNCY